MDNSFGQKLNALRKARGLSSVELARQAGIGTGLLSGLIHEQRVVGERNARKLGKALALRGRELDSFIYAAIDRCSEKVLEASKPYPARLLNLVACKLREHGITPEKIARYVWNQEEMDAALFLKDGSTASIKLELVCG